MTSNIVRFDALRTLTAAQIIAGAGSFVALGTPLGHAMRVLHFTNETDGDMIVSFDGTTDNAILPAMDFALYDLTSDEDNNESFRYEKGTQIYIRYISLPTTGNFYLTAIYGKGE